MKQSANILRFIYALTVFNLMHSSALAGPGIQHWTMLRQESQFKELKVGDKVAFVCTECNAISPLPIQSPEQAKKLAQEGASVACPNCQLVTKVIVRASRKDLNAPPVVTYVNEKGEEVAFMTTMPDTK